MIRTRKANPVQPLRIMLYGPEGVGKSTFGARADRPVFISAEGGTDQLKDADGNPIDEMLNEDGTALKTWDHIVNAIRRLASEEHQFQTVVLDSADWIEKLCHAKIIGTSGRSIITANGGYGAGFAESEKLHRELIESLIILEECKRMNVVIIGHSHVKPVKDPDMLEDYDGNEIKCHEKVSSLWREWVKALIFARFKTYIRESEKNGRARAIGDGARVAYTVKRPSFQAKNRYGLPPEMDFTENFWNELKPLCQGNLKEAQSEIKRLAELVTDKKLKATVDKSISDAGDNMEKLLPMLSRLREITKKESK